MTRDCMYYPKAGIVLKVTASGVGPLGPICESPIHVIDGGDALYVRLRYYGKPVADGQPKLIDIAVFHDVFANVDRKELNDTIRSTIRFNGYSPDEFDPMPVAVEMPTDMYDAFLKRVNARKGVRNG